MIHYFLYKTTFQKTGAYYLGMHRTSNLEDGYLGSGLRLKRLIKKYGKEYFIREILSFHENEEEMKKAEELLIDKKKLQDPLCLNLATGGLGGFGPGSLGFRKGIEKFLFLMKNDTAFNGKMKNILKQAALARKTFKGGPLLEMTEKAQSPQAREKRIRSFKENQHQRGSANSQFGSTCIYHPTLKQNKRISKQDLEIWLKEGWVPGSNVGSQFIYHPNHPKSKMVPKEHLEEWISKGWKLGMKKKDEELPLSSTS